MGNVKSTIYSTTAKDPMTQLNFSTDFQESSARVTIDLVKSGTVVKTATYNLDSNSLIEKVAIDIPKMISDATITLAANARSVVFSGVCVWEDVTSFRAENVAVAYR